MQLLFRFFLSLYLLSNHLQANFLVEYQKQFITSKQDVQNQYIEYKKNYDITWQWYKEEIKKHWKTFEYSSREYFVDYQNNFQNKTTIDFRNGIIYLYTINDNEKLAADIIASMFTRLMELDVNNAYQGDVFENKLLLNLNKVKKEVDNNFLLLGDLFSKNQQLEIEKMFLTTPFSKTQYKEKTIYSIRLKLPKDFTQKREIYFKKIFKKYAKKYQLPPELLYSIFLNLSYFNPYPKDTEPSYGIMNLRLDDMAMESYYTLMGRYKFLDSVYLYNFDNNIQLAAIYLKQIYLNDFADIKDKKNKIIVSAMVYKYGLKTLYSIFKVENKEDLIKEIVQYNSSRLYKYIFKKLKDKEKQSYLYRIKWEMEHYE